MRKGIQSAINQRLGTRQSNDSTVSDDDSLTSKQFVWTENRFLNFKNEPYHDIKHQTHEEMKYESFEYIEVFDERPRLYPTHSYLSPTAYLQR